MSSTNKTTHYELPQFVENDIFNPLVDDNDAYEKIDTALYNIADAEADDAAEIVGIKSRLDTAEGKVEALETQNGTDVLTTVAQTLSGAVNELKSGEDSLDGRLDTIEDDINNISSGLKTRVTALETQNGSEVLETTAQTLSGAVNELDGDIDTINTKIGSADILTMQHDNLVDAINNNFIGSTFASQRYGSAKGYGGQATVYHDDKLFISGEDYSTNEDFFIEEFNANTMVRTQTYSYHYACHPNAMFIIGEELFVVDSDNHKIYVIKFSTMDIDRVINSVPNTTNIISGCVWNDKVYLLGGGYVYKCDTEFTVEESILLETRLNPSGLVSQGLFVYDDYIYIVFNRPNALGIYNMDGDFIAVKDIGVGNGYYPYGELETFFMMGDNVCFCSVLWDNPSVGFGIIEIFISNINKPVLSDNYYGQAATLHGTLYAEKDFARSKNPKGLSSADKFDSSYEAACVFNYLYKEYNCIEHCNFVGDFSDDAVVIENCKLLVNENAHIGTLRAYNCTLMLPHNATIDDLYTYDCIVMAERAVIANWTDDHGMVWTGGSKITGELSFLATEFFDASGNWTASGDDITISGGRCTKLDSIVGGGNNPITTNALVYNGYAAKQLWTHYKPLGKAFYFGLITDVGNANVLCVNISGGNSTSIAEGGTVDRYIATLVSNAGTPVIIKFKLTFSATGIEISSVSGADLAGNAVTVGSIYLNMPYVCIAHNQS